MGNYIGPSRISTRQSKSTPNLHGPITTVVMSGIPSAIALRRSRISTGPSKSIPLWRLTITVVFSIRIPASTGRPSMIMTRLSKPTFHKAEVFCNRGAAYGSLGDHMKAIEDYDRAIEIDPEHAKAYFNRGVAYGNLAITFRPFRISTGQLKSTLNMREHTLTGGWLMRSWAIKSRHWKI